MIIPIPSHKKRFTITLKVKALNNLNLGLKVYDPYRSYSHYFRRKAYLQRGQKRTFMIPIPVSPEALELEIYDKNTGDDDTIELLDFKVKLMEAPQLWVTPEQERFFDFAVDFAKKAGYIRTGFYDSPKGEFLFQFLPSIVDPFGKELITPARTSRTMPRVQISQKAFRTLTIPVRVFILAHEGCHWFLNTRSQKTADLCGIRQYLDYGFPKIEAVYAATQIFGKHPQLVGEAQLQRTKDIVQFIDHYTNKK